MDFIHLPSSTGFEFVLVVSSFFCPLPHHYTPSSWVLPSLISCSLSRFHSPDQSALAFSSKFTIPLTSSNPSPVVLPRWGGVVTEAQPVTLSYNILSGTVYKYSLEIPGSQSLGSHIHITIKESIQNSTQLGDHSNRGSHTEDSQRYTPLSFRLLDEPAITTIKLPLRNSGPIKGSHRELQLMTFPLAPPWTNDLKQIYL